MAEDPDKTAPDKPDDDQSDRPATTSQPSGSVHQENPADKPLPGDDKLDMDRTPGDGSLQGSTPAGLTVKELLERAEDADDLSQPGTG
jgi:hypothetical protein